MDNLTYREKKILQFLTNGLTNREMSKELCTSEETVNKTIQRMFEKTGCTNRVKLALYAERSKSSLINVG